MFTHRILTDLVTTNSFTQEEYSTLRLINRLFSAISIFGLFLIILFFILFKSLRSFALELVVWLSLASIFFYVSNFFPVNEQDNEEAFVNKTLSASCFAQALLNIFFDLCALIWTTLIGYTAFISVENQKSLDENKMKYRLAYLGISVIVPLVLTLIIILTGSYGPAGSFCWIATEINSTETKLYTVIYYSLSWLIIICDCFFVIKLIRYLKKELGNEKEIIDRYTRKLIWYPLIQIICYLPATINRVYGLFATEPSFPLMVIQVIFDSLSGVAYSVVYGFNYNVRQEIRKLLCCVYCKKKRVSIQITSSMTTEMNSTIIRKRSVTSIEDTIEYS